MSKPVTVHRAVAHKIRNQYRGFVERDGWTLPESMLFYKILEAAILDLPQRDAVWYLTQPVIPAAELGGVDSDWVRRTLRRAKLL